MKYVYVIEYYTPNHERVRDNVLARNDEEARQKFSKKHVDDVDFATIVDWIRVDYQKKLFQKIAKKLLTNF